MNKQVLLFSILFAMSSFSTLFAQSNIHKVIGTMESDAVRGVIQQPDGTIILAGFTSRFTAPFDDGLIIALDSTGDTVFTAIIQTPLSDKINAIEPEKNGNFYVAGMLGHPGGNFEEDPFIAKIDASGNLIWAKTYGDSTFQSDHFNAVACDTVADVVYATGRSQAQTLVVKADANTGNTIWANQYGVGEGNTIAVRNDGDVVVGGEDSGTGTVIMVDDTTGILLKSSEYITNFGMKVLDVVDQDGCVLVLGVTNQPSSGDDVFLMKVDYAGNILWKRKYGNNATNQASALVQATDTTVVVAGLYNQSGNVNGYSWVMEVNTAQEGDTVANHFYQAGNGGVELTDMIAIMPENTTTPVGYVFVGTDLGSASGDNNFYVMGGDGIYRRGTCPPSLIDVSEFVVDTFGVTVSEDTTFSPTMLEELDASLIIGVDPEGIVEVSEDLKATLSGEFTMNDMPTDSFTVEVFGRNSPSEEYQFHTTKKLPGTVDDLENRVAFIENLVRAKGNLGAERSFTTYFEETTRWEDATPITVNGCEQAVIGRWEGTTVSTNFINLTDNTLEGTLTVDPSVAFTFGDFSVRYKPNAVLYKKDNPNAVSTPLLELDIDLNGYYKIDNVPPTAPGESYEIHVNFPGLPIVNPHNNITVSNRFMGEPRYDFIIHDTFIEGVITIDSTTSISSSVLQDFGMQVYPNPASDQIQLEARLSHPGARVILSDYWGREVYVHPETLEIGQQTIQIPVSEFAAGIYTLRIEIDGLGWQVKKVQLR